MLQQQMARSYDIVQRFRRFAASVLGSKICLGLLLVPFYKSSFYDYYGSLSSISNILLTLEVYSLLTIFLICGYRSKLLLFLAAYYLWDCFLAPFLGGTTSPGLYYCYQAIGFTLLVLLGLNGNKKSFLDNLSLIMCFACVANYVLLLCYPDGVVSDANGSLWLFGIRTGFALVLVPSMCVSVLRDCICGRTTFSLRTIIVIAVAILSITNQWVATGIVELVFIALLYIILSITNKINIRVIALIICITGVVIVVFGPSSFMSGWLDLLGRDSTFTGRTEIWQSTIIDIAENPVYGLGGIEYVVVHEAVKGFHCLWLSVAHESGIPGLLIYVAMFIYCVSAFDKSKAKKPALIVGVFFLGILVASFIEIQTYFPFMYALLAFADYFSSHSVDVGDTSIPVLMKIR